MKDSRQNSLDDHSGTGETGRVASQGQSKRAYHAPELVTWGTVGSLTAGKQTGNNDGTTGYSSSG